MAPNNPDADSAVPEPDELPPLPHGRPLSDADRDLFLSILDNPPPPNAALRKLMSSAD